MKLKIKLLASWRLRFQLRAEGDKLRAEGDKLWAEGDKLWAEAILDVRGNVTVDWKNDGSCVLGTGEVFTKEDAESLPAALAEAHEKMAD